ncbi:MAG: TerB family tellurite resistance protein, partial [Terriglobia bacterium]
FFEEGARLSPETTEELLLLAEQARRQAVELWQFTHLIAENFSVEQKLNLVEAMWTLIYIDGKLDMREDNLIHKLSTLLGLRHSELIETKLRVLRQKGSNESDLPPISH